ncbi:hypothetical protein CN354_07935 [Bacillus cereus]|nr:hypothetical protein CN354_07935 [Bacillus cereus]WJE55660.1 hypothetical protein QRE66_28065 [Bacillus cereus]
MPFTFETVDSQGGQACLALDKNNNPHVAYAGGSGKLMLASRTAETGKWTREELSGGGLIGASDSDRVCLEIDSEGNPHVAYRELNSGNLFYGVKRNNSWSFTPVPTSRFNDPRGVSGYSFKLHSGRMRPELRDTPHFAYNDLTSSALGYTRKVQGQFKRIKVAEQSLFDVGRYTSMALDELSGTFLIAYIEELEQGEPDPAVPPQTRVRMTRIIDPFEGTVGHTSLIDNGQFQVARPTSIASDGGWCVTYADLTTNTLKASFFDFSLPESHKETVATTVFPVVPFLAKMPGGDYRIAYGDENKLKLASRNQFGMWIVEVVDPEGGGMPSLAYDTLGNAHIVYTVGNALKYAKGTSRWRFK